LTGQNIENSHFEEFPYQAKKLPHNYYAQKCAVKEHKSFNR